MVLLREPQPPVRLVLIGTIVILRGRVMESLIRVVHEMQRKMIKNVRGTRTAPVAAAVVPIHIVDIELYHRAYQ